jgi:hypothetical protein
MPSLSQVKTTLGAFGESTFSSGIASRFGQQVVTDFYTYMALIGAAYQVRAGTITTPLVGDSPITDARAEMCADCASGTTIIPVYLNVSLRLLTGTLHEYAAKSVATVSSAGTAFVPLPLKAGGSAAVSTARVAAHAVTVTAELATTTLRHWSLANPAAGATGALPTANGTIEWTPRTPPILVGPRCFYVQLGAAGTGPSYYAHFDYLEAPTSVLT